MPWYGPEVAAVSVTLAVVASVHNGCSNFASWKIALIVVLVFLGVAAAVGAAAWFGRKAVRERRKGTTHDENTRKWDLAL